MVKATGLAKSRGPYVIIDQGRVTFDTDDIFKAVDKMKKASDNAKLYKLEESEEGGRTPVLLAFRKGVPAAATDKVVANAQRQQHGPVEPLEFVAPSF